MNFFKKLDFDNVKSDSKASGLKRTLGVFNIIMIGLGVMVGTGALVLTGDVAANYAGPAVMLSYMLAGLVGILIALVYSELASMLPASGGLYTYTYVAYGEIFAWFSAGVLVLEFCFGSAVVAAGWSGYVTNIIKSAGIMIPEMITNVPSHGGVVNLPAILILLFVMLVIYRGSKDSKTINDILVYVKLGVIGIFIILAIPNFNIENWSDFMPFGVQKIIAGSGILFLAFSGVSSIACMSEECINPGRDLKIGIIGCLVIVSLVYLVMAGLVTGIAPYYELGISYPFAYALQKNGIKIGALIISIGAVAAMTNVILVLIYSVSRLFYVVGRDGVVPSCFAKLHNKYDSPYIAVVVFSLISIIIAGFLPYSLIGKLASMAVIIDYIIASSIVMLFRIKHPNVERPFVCPLLFVIAPLTIIICMYLLYIQVFDVDSGVVLESGTMLLYVFISFLVMYILKKILSK